MGALIFLAVLTVFQGQALQVEHEHEAGLEGATIAWGGRDVPFVREGERWLTVIGVDLDVEPGQHPAPISLHYAGGRTQTRQEVIDVKGKSFPTTRLTVAPKYVELSPENRARAKREAKETAALYARLTPHKYWTGKFETPIPGVRGGRNFGSRRVFNNQPRAPHSGADLKASTGTKILASNAGKVVLAHDFFFNGKAVFVDHGLGVYTMYLHLSKILVQPGDMVKRGQLLGVAGATGRVTGPHLHWGVRIGDARVDPFSLMEMEAD